MLLPALVLSLVVSQPVLAHSSHHSHTSDACPCRVHSEDMAKSLNLTADQQAKIKAIRTATKASMKSDWEQMKSIRSQMRALTMSPSMDEAKMNDLISQKTTLMATMMKNRMMAKNKIFNVLNAKQQEQFQMMMKNHDKSVSQCMS